jgi:hypothetical protein
MVDVLLHVHDIVIVAKPDPWTKGPSIWGNSNPLAEIGSILKKLAGSGRQRQEGPLVSSRCIILDYSLFPSLIILLKVS